MNTVLFSSASDEWETPPDLFAEWDEEFHFNLDLAATSTNALCHAFFDKQTDALTQAWHTHGTVGFCNPPYSRRLQKLFVQKAVDEAPHAFTTVLLLPARTDTWMFHEYIWDRLKMCPQPMVDVQFLKGRLRFRRGGQVAAPAPFPSMLVTIHGY